MMSSSDCPSTHSTNSLTFNPPAKCRLYRAIYKAIMAMVLLGLFTMPSVALAQNVGAIDYDRVNLAGFIGTFGSLLGMAPFVYIYREDFKNLKETRKPPWKALILGSISAMLCRGTLSWIFLGYFI